MKNVLVFVLCILSSACANLPKESYKQSSPMLRNATVQHRVSIVEQSRIDVDVPTIDASSVSAQYGFVGMMVGGMITKGENKNIVNSYNSALEHVTNNLSSTAVADVFHQELDRATRDVSWLDSSKFFNKKQKNPAEVSMFMESNYRFSIDFTSIVSTVEVTVVKGSETLFKNRYVWISDALPLPVKTEQDKIRLYNEAMNDYKALTQEQKKNKKVVEKAHKAIRRAKSNEYSELEALAPLAVRWAENNGALVSLQLKRSARELAQLIQADLQSLQDKGTGKVIHLTTNSHGSFPVELITKTVDRVNYRNISNGNIGIICSVPTSYSNGYVIWRAQCR